MTIGRKVISASTLERLGGLLESLQRDSNNEFESAMSLNDLNIPVLCFRRCLHKQEQDFQQGTLCEFRIWVL